jgi:hypothetical protein
LRATYFCQVLPLVRGFPTLGVLRLIRLPKHIPAGFPFHSTPPPACSEVPSVHLGSDLTLCPGFPFRASLVVYLMSGLSFGQKSMGLPGFSDTSLASHATYPTSMR